MWTVINSFDRTAQVQRDIAIQASATDPLARLDFTLKDPGSHITLQEVQEVLVFDENTKNLDGTTAIPAYNAVINVFLANTGGGPTQVPGAWSTSGTNLSLFAWTDDHLGNRNVVMTFSNSAVGSGLAYQNVLAGNVQPGQSYMFSCNVTGGGTITNIQSLVELIWLDSSLSPISTLQDVRTPPTSTTRIAVSGVAPSNAYAIQVVFGGQSTNATNSGTITFDTPQCEPMWFASSQGISYPTPPCNAGDANSTVLPDGSSTRTCRVFAGYIDDLYDEYAGVNRTWTVSCAGPGSVLENQNLISINYSVPTYDDVIINNILSTYYVNILSSGSPRQQAPPTTVQRGALMDSLSINDGTFREILNGLADTSGYIFYVDNYYYLRYQPLYWDVTPITISDSPDYITSYPPQDYKLQRDATAIKSRVKVVGGKFLAPAIPDTFSGDGTTKVFNLSFQPYNIAGNVTVGGSGVKTGIKGVNTLNVGGYLALVDKGGQTLTFQNAPAAGTNNIVLTYTYEAPVAVVVQSLDSYAKYKRWFDSKVNDSTLTSLKAATNRGLSELTKYAFARPILTLKLQRLIYPGTTVLFTSSHDGYTSQPFTVQTMRITTLGGGIYIYEYQCGFYNPTFVDHLRNVHKALNRSQTTANVTAAVQTDLVSSDNTIHYTDSVSVTTGGTGPYVYGTAKYGYSSYS